MRSNQISNRRRHLLFLLEEAQEPLSAAECGNKLGVTTRTIERDVAALRRGGFDISSSVGRGGGLISHSSDGDLGRSFHNPEIPLTEVDHILGDLSGNARHLVMVSAVLGSELTAELLRITSQNAETGVQSSREGEIGNGLEELLGASILESAPLSENMRFSSDAMRQAVLDRSGDKEIRDLHLAAANALEKLHGESSAEYSSQIALHLIQSGVANATGKAVDYVFVAAQESRALGDHAGAIRWFRWIVETPPHHVNRDLLLAAKSGLAISLASASSRSSVSEAVSLLRDAVEEYLRGGDVELAVEIALTECQPVSGDSIFSTDIAGMLEVVLEHRSVDEQSKARLLALYCHALLVERNDLESAVRAASEAASIAVKYGDEKVKLSTDHLGLTVLARQGQPHVVIRQASEIVDLALSVGDRKVEFSSRFHLTTNLMMIGELATAESNAEIMLNRSEAMGVSTASEQAQGILASVDMVRGNFGQALERSGRAREQFGSTAWTVLPATLIGVYDGTVPALPQGVTNDLSRWRIPFETSVLAIATGIWKPNPSERNSLRKLVDDFDESGGAPGGRATRIAIDLLLDGLDGNGDRMRSLLSAESDLTSLLIGFAGVPISAVFGIGLTAIGDVENARSAFDSAIETSRKSGALPQLGFALLNRALLDTDPMSSSVDSWLHESRTIANEFGISTLARRVREFEDSETDGVIDDSGPLTRREKDVLSLLAAGRTTREISEMLYVTESTVNRHTTNIFTKIGARNRVEATGYAYRSGLIL